MIEYQCENEEQEITIEDFFDLIYPEGGGILAMVYQAFIDDSKDRHAEKVVVSGIFIGDKDKWSFLRSEWKKVLQPHGMKYFKAAEYYGLRDEFAQFQSKSKYPPPAGREAAKKIFDDLEDVIRRAKITSLGVVIPISDYSEVMAMPEAQGKIPSLPYDLALNSGFFETIKDIKKISGRHMVSFVHDDDGRFAHFRELYLKFRKKNPKTAKMIGGFIPLDDKKHPPLQAADLAANVTCNYAKQWLDDKSEASLQRLIGSMYKIGVWEKDYILSVLQKQK